MSAVTTPAGRPRRGQATDHLTSTICAALRRRLPGYGTATSNTLQRRFLNTGGIIETTKARPPSDWPGAHLLTGPVLGQPARNDHRAMVGRPDAPLPVRLTEGRFA